MYAQLFALCRALSPRWRAASCCSGAPAIPWPRVLLALFATQAALLACAVRMALSRNVTWSGVTYTRAAGRVRVAARL